MLKHFGTYQSCEIKALKVTEFCWGKREEKKPTLNQSSPQRFSFAFISSIHVQRTSWPESICSVQTNKKGKTPERAQELTENSTPDFCLVREHTIRSKM